MNKYKLTENMEPELLRNIFPYSEVPKIEFENSIILNDIPDEIWITDTTFRDGQQAMAPFKEEHIVELFKMMSELGGEKGLIRQSEFFIYSERDRNVVRKCQELGLKFPEITSWIRANKDDFKYVKEMGIKETGILTSVSDYHVFLKLKKDRKTVMNEYLDVVRTAVENGVKPRCHLEDITRADFYGFVVPFVNELMEIGRESGVPVKIRLCDTMGYGLPFPNAKLPRSVPKMVNVLKTECGVPSEQMEWHGHNDFHKVLVNGVAAWMHGCSSVNGTLLGIGERTGNPPIEGLIMDYLGIKGHDSKINTRIITKISNFMENEMGITVPERYPFVGKDFNVTKAGIHADGVLKNEEIYNIFDTNKLLDRPLQVMVTDKSGVAGIAYWINTNLIPKEEISKKHPALTKIYKWIQEQYNEGRISPISDEELMKLTRKYLPELFRTEFDILEEKSENMAISIAEEYAAKSEIISMNRENIEPVLKELVENNRYIQMAYVTNVDGVQITENIVEPWWIEKAKAISTIGTDKSSREWYTEVLKNGKTYITQYYISKLTDKLCVTASALISNENGEFAGVLGIDFNFSGLAGIAEIENEE